ncbi:hypothetical protein DPX16_3530 [Anabarilius grahami]|uniref:SGNH hydrolase-type esterase domain-containing protein n=1 Tax=Anabarilius grahami TaxID=495550 RepID=A0A3N0YX56_ANAGA|nr:hypothetical protein DPX16_3530 [Anabarilius grahami]
MKCSAHLKYWSQITAPSLFFDIADDRVPRVWIVGSSIIRRLYAHICEQGLDRNLGLRCRITWEGRGGRLWEQLLPVLRSLRTKAPAPDILVIHLGGNSVCREGRNRLDFLREMKTDLAEVLRLLPRTRLLFSSILPRLNWRGQIARSAYGIERSRRWLNKRDCRLPGRETDALRSSLEHRPVASVQGWSPPEPRGE